MTKLIERLRKGLSSDDEHITLGGVMHDALRLEAADLLDECETLIGAMRQEIQNLGGSLEGVITADATLAKLRAAQERADE